MRLRWVVPVIVVVLAAPPSRLARAQQIKGRFMVILDTSGSMGMHFKDANPLSAPPTGDYPGGDGSTLYSDSKVQNQNWFPGKLLANGTRDGVNSRLYAAKNAITNAVNAYTGDVDFGLETFDFALCPYSLPQCETCSLTASGYNCLYANNAFSAFVGVNWSSEACQGPDPAWKGGRILVSPDAGSGLKILPWIDGKEDHRTSNDGSTSLRAAPACATDADCPGGLAGSCVQGRCFNCTSDADCPGGAAGACKRIFCNNDKQCPGGTLNSCSGGNCRASYCFPSCKNINDCNGVLGSCVGGFCNNLITPRNGPPLNGTPLNPEVRASGNTPLAEAITVAQTQWFDKVKGGDTQANCRPYGVIVATDGVQSNNGGCGADPVAAARALYQDNNANPVLTYVIGVSIQAQDQAQLNSIAAAGGTVSARLANDAASIEAAFADILSKSIKVEYCNNKDDNCNGIVDEGYDKGAACTIGIGVCQRTGIKKCDPNNNTQTVCCVDDGNPNGPCTALVAGAPQVEICNGLDDNCNGLVDEGGVCQKPQCFPETCNGKDDDCDGVIDNAPIDVGRACGFNIGICTPGITACLNSMNQDVSKGGVPDAGDHLVCQGGTQPRMETCNGLDDDCDGVTDGMSRACYDGAMGTDGVGICHDGLQKCNSVPGSGVASWGVCVGEVTPRGEICNGVDDDCNGKIDDVMGANVACCPSGKCGTGICRAGSVQCSGGALQCLGGQGPQGEICNGLDDDCNGKVDDVAGLGKPCTPVGGCTGVLVCDLQKMAVVCSSIGMGGLEVCNGRDDNCNGLIDEEPDVSMNDPRIGQPCGNPMNLPPPCMPGKTVCKGGQPVCQGAVGPQAESCNCKDDDCNGTVDDNAFCPPGTRCVSCGCYATCGGGEFPCPGGYSCLDVTKKMPCDAPGQNADCYCIPEQTCNPPCQPNEECRPAQPPATGGICVDRCAGVTCRDFEKCINGACSDVSCASRTNPTPCKPCVGGAGGERCDTVQRTCVPDLCCGKDCQGGVCQPFTGECIRSCIGVKCGNGQKCLDGACVEDKCAAIQCPELSVCDPGTGACVKDACLTAPCVPGLACCIVNGAASCIQDPCTLVQCDAGYKCTLDRVTCHVSCDQPKVAQAAQDRVVGAGGGGFALGCSVGAPSRRTPASRGLALLALALGALVRRRRPGRSLGGRKEPTR